ncbi:unnamed protein product [Paramecium primaurelia]|uniref:Diacylglycerol kinase n=1 Tax=Paramecium primaurelia TaxID=5886 RepID=A0A8S1NUZ0_PARPR|nr:unnamed protein product [Paramecium primaurelia]
MQYQQFSESEQQQSTLNLGLFYLFYNSGSGSVKANQFCILDCADITVNIEGKDVQISFFSIQNVTSRNQGYCKLKEDLRINNKQIPIIIAGGDGSMMWVIEQMISQNIDINQIVIIPLPCGTGNDFSNALGWDTDIPGNMLENDYKILKQYIRYWQRGHQCFFDIWDITIQTQQDGYFQEIKKNEKGYIKQSVKDLDGMNTNSLEKKMSNYFSIGVDARIGYGFDKNRTTNRHINKICYCLQGIQKMFLKNPRVNQVVQFVEHFNHKEQKTLFKTVNCQDKNALTIPGNPATLVCLNINSYAAGITDIWKNAKTPQEFLQKNKLYSEKTSFSDGLLEFISFDSIVGIGSERVLSGNATRLAQTNGPLYIKFQEPNDNTTVNSYIQIDGQFFCVVNPLSVEIQPCRLLPQGKIKILMKN